MKPPIVIDPPADFVADDEAGNARLAAFQGWSQITTRNVNAALRTCLRGAVREAESVMCRAVLRQTREQLHPPGSYREVLLLGEPFVSIAGGELGVFEVDASGDERGPLQLRPDALQPAHGRIYFDNWDTDAVWRRVRFEAGWAGDAADPIPPDVEQGIFALAAATWNRRPALADAARDHLRARYRLAESGWLTTGV